MQKSKVTAMIEFAEHPEGIQLLKGGEEMLTPKRLPLVVPTLALAEAIISELMPPLTSPLQAAGMKNQNAPPACGDSSTIPPACGAPNIIPPACGGDRGGEAISAKASPPYAPPVNGGGEEQSSVNGGGKEHSSVRGGGKRPLTQLAYTAIDLVQQSDDSLIEAMLAYLHTDTICYFAEAPELNHRERKYWQPIIDWASERFNCEINSFEGVMPSDQPEETVDIIRQHIAGLDPWTLTCLLEFTRGFSSLLLGLAVVEKRLDADTAFDCSQVDEDYQREEWGTDEEAMERREKLKAEMLAAERFLGML